MIAVILAVYFAAVVGSLWLLIVEACWKHVAGAVVAALLEILVYWIMPYVFEWCDDIDLNAKEDDDV